MSVQEPLLVPQEELTPELQKAFYGAQALTNSEVYILLENMRAQRAAAESQPTVALPPLVEKTIHYCGKFNCGKGMETVNEIRMVLGHHPLHQFEMVTIANLLPDTADEAMALLPSLKQMGEGGEAPRFMPEDVQTMLDEVLSHRM